jgi:hypothetical protein
MPATSAPAAPNADRDNDKAHPMIISSNSSSGWKLQATATDDMSLKFGTETINAVSTGTEMDRFASIDKKTKWGVEFENTSPSNNSSDPVIQPHCVKFSSNVASTIANNGAGSLTASSFELQPYYGLFLAGGQLPGQYVGTITYTHTVNL